MNDENRNEDGTAKTATQDNRERLDKLEERIDGICTATSSTAMCVSDHDARLDALKSRLQALEERVQRIAEDRGRLNLLEQSAREFQRGMEEIRKALAGHEEQLQQTSKVVTRLARATGRLKRRSLRVW